LCSDPVNEAEDTCVDPWLVSLSTPLPPAGDAWGEKPRLHYSWRCLRGETKTTLQLEMPGGIKRKLHHSWRRLRRETKPTLQLEMPGERNPNYITVGDA